MALKDNPAVDRRNALDAAYFNFKVNFSPFFMGSGH
jgi:hypothetical protein